MGLPNPGDELGPIPETTPAEARRAAAHITRRYGDNSRPILEALGLIGYVGHEMTTGHWKPCWREGTVQ